MIDLSKLRKRKQNKCRIPTMEERIKAYVDQHDLCITRLSIAIGFSHQTILEWTSGRKLPLVSSIHKFCVETGISLDYLLGFNDNINFPSKNPLSFPAVFVERFNQYFNENNYSFYSVELQHTKGGHGLYQYWALGKFMPSLYALKGFCIHEKLSADWLIGLSDGRRRIHCEKE